MNVVPACQGAWWWWSPTLRMWVKNSQHPKKPTGLGKRETCSQNLWCLGVCGVFLLTTCRGVRKFNLICQQTVPTNQFLCSCIMGAQFLRCTQVFWYLWHSIELCIYVGSSSLLGICWQMLVDIGASMCIVGHRRISKTYARMLNLWFPSGLTVASCRLNAWKLRLPRFESKR